MCGPGRKMKRVRVFFFVFGLANDSWWLVFSEAALRRRRAAGCSAAKPSSQERALFEVSIGRPRGGQRQVFILSLALKHIHAHTHTHACNPPFSPLTNCHVQGQISVPDLCFFVPFNWQDLALAFFFHFSATSSSFSSMSTVVVVVEVFPVHRTEGRL